MAQSSVEWLASKVQEHFYITDKDALYPIFQEWINQAKAMHREEIKKAWEEGFSFSSPYQSAEIYYNETFGNETE